MILCPGVIRKFLSSSSPDEVLTSRVPVVSLLKVVDGCVPLKFETGVMMKFGRKIAPEVLSPFRNVLVGW